MELPESDILCKAQQWSEEKRATALATVIETWGSAPRPVGSRLVIDSKGNFFGSVSGGCVEADIITEAQDQITRGGSRLIEFGVADETAWRVGLSCGGRIKVYVEAIDAAKMERLAAFNAERANRRPCVLLTNLASGEQRLIRVNDFDQDPLADLLKEQLRQAASGIVVWRGQSLFLCIERPAIRLVVIGAVHVSQMLVPIASLAGFDMVIIDPRTAFATEERFPRVKLIADWPDEVFRSLPLDPYTAVVLLTHDPRIDDQGLMAALQAGCFYIGALGSRKTHAKRLERLRAQGFAETALADIHAPIGLDIGATSPAEIAISIASEIIATLHRRNLRQEREKAA